MSSLESGDTDSLYYSDRASTPGIDQPTSETIQSTTSFLKRKREEDPDEEQEDKGRFLKIRSTRRVEDSQMEDDQTDSEGTVKGAGGGEEETFNKRDFRVILDEVCGQTELIESAIVNA